MLRKTKNGERRTFGKNGKAWLTVETTEDGEAYLRELSLGGDPDIRTVDIVAALDEQYGIVAGIDAPFIDRILAQARKEPDREYFGKKDLLVASNIPHVKPVDGRVDYRFLKMVTRRGDLPYREMRAAFKEPDIRGVLAQDLTVVAARPGDELAVRVAPREGTDGCDIFGKTTVRAHTPANAKLLAGTNVEIVGDTAIAQTFGYVSVLNHIVSVISPIWISPNNLEAHYVHFPHAGPQVIPQADWIFDLFESLSLTAQPQERTIGSLIRNLVDGGAKKRSFLLASGTPPTRGRDAYLECSFDEAGVHEQMMQEGRIDTDRLRASVSVRKGQLIGTLIPPAPGEPGTDLKGGKIPAPDGVEVTFEPGENVFTEEEDGRVRYFYSEIDGNAHLRDTTLSVHSVLRIEGDVDGISGDIVAGNDVEISGSVRDGAKVNAAGSVTVLGRVEGGAAISAKGNVIITEGVQGEKTKVIALGSVETRYVRDGSIMAKEDITIGDHCHNANVRSGRELTVKSGGSDRGGSIIGGQVHATTRLQADSIGSATGSGTVVGIAADIAVEARLKKTSEQVEFCDSNILRMFRTLGIQSLDTQTVEALIKRTPPWRKQPVVQLIIKLRELVTLREDALKAMEAVIQEKADLMDQAEVAISTKVFADTVLEIGTAKLRISEDIESAIFTLSHDNITWRSASDETDVMQDVSDTSDEPDA